MPANQVAAVSTIVREDPEIADMVRRGLVKPASLVLSVTSISSRGRVDEWRDAILLHTVFIFKHTRVSARSAEVSGANEASNRVVLTGMWGNDGKWVWNGSKIPFELTNQIDQTASVESQDPTRVDWHLATS